MRRYCARPPQRPSIKFPATCTAVPDTVTIFKIDVGLRRGTCQVFEFISISNTTQPHNNTAPQRPKVALPRVIPVPYSCAIDVAVSYFPDLAFELDLE
ncbi:hypothetical protein KCU99_g118, partial [Aureobasidium melanogenum]